MPSFELLDLEQSFEVGDITPEIALQARDIETKLLFNRLGAYELLEHQALIAFARSRLRRADSTL